MAAPAIAAAPIDIFDPNSPVFLNNKRQFRDFLEESYDAKIDSMMDKGLTRLVVSISDIREYRPELSQGLLRQPMEYYMPFVAALNEIVRAKPSRPAHKIDPDTEYAVGLTGDFGAHHVSPRQLLAHHIGQMVAVDGITTKLGSVRPKVFRTTHYCEATRRYSEQRYHDGTSLSGYPTGAAYPTKDDAGNPLDTEFGLSSYEDHQTLAIQEMPERSPAGLLPRSVDVILGGDLVDSCKPGDRVRIIGIYRALPSASMGETKGIFRSVLIANYVRPLKSHTIDAADISPADLHNIRQFSRRPDCFDLLARSVAPSIFGHDFIKKAILLLLLGGVEKNLANGTHLRGDINLLMVGDPSTAKSQLLRFVLNIAPLALNTTGRGSSGVGLTAAVVSDKDTGERRLEAGAMVLADRGVVCIDEFDKMSDADRVAIHEVMEQQTVTIAKAGIHMSLNARCSVVAAANPIYGQYDASLPPHVNVHLPDSLLSRFDLLFIVLDQPDARLDRLISDRVLSNHRYTGAGGRNTGGGGGSAAGSASALGGGGFVDSMMLDDEPEETNAAEQATDVFVKYDRLLHGELRPEGASELISVDFMKKYIQFAKQQYQPVLSEAACELIGTYYTELRAGAAGNDRAIPVTARQLETLIRLSTAHAKCHLRKTVEESDVEAAYTVVRFAIDNNIVGEEDREAAAAAAGAAGAGGGADDDEDDDGGQDDAQDDGGDARGGDEDDGQDDSEDEDDDQGVRLRRRARQGTSQSKSRSSASSSSSAAPSSRVKQQKTSKKRSAARVSQDTDEEEEELKADSDGLDDVDAVMADDDADSGLGKRKKVAGETGSQSPAKRQKSVERLLTFQQSLAQLRQQTRRTDLDLDELMAHVNEGRRPADRFSEREAVDHLQRLQDENKLMMRERRIHLI